ATSTQRHGSSLARMLTTRSKRSTRAAAFGGSPICSRNRLIRRLRLQPNSSANEPIAAAPWVSLSCLQAHATPGQVGPAANSRASPRVGIHHRTARCRVPEKARRSRVSNARLLGPGCRKAAPKEAHIGRDAGRHTPGGGPADAPDQCSIERRGRRGACEILPGQMPELSVPVRGLFEAHLPVSDLGRSVAFYRDVVGLQLAIELPERAVAFFWCGAPGKTMLGLWSQGSMPMAMSLHIA